MRMRLSHSKLCTIIIVLVNVVLMFLFWKYFSVSDEYGATERSAMAAKQVDHIQSTNKHIKKTITVVIRDFYDFENDLQRSIDSILNLIPSVQILVIYNVEPYPPMPFMANYSAMYSNVRFIDLSFDVKKSSKTLSPVFGVRTKYALFLPDSVRLGGRSILQKMLKEIESETAKKANSKGVNRKVVVTQFASSQKTAGNCCSIKNDAVNWTMEFTVKNGSADCDMVSAGAQSSSFPSLQIHFHSQFLQKHGILIETAFLRMLPDPLAQPFPEMLYIQAKAAKSTVSASLRGDVEKSE